MDTYIVQIIQLFNDLIRTIGVGVKLFKTYLAKVDEASGVSENRKRTHSKHVNDDNYDNINCHSKKKKNKRAKLSLPSEALEYVSEV